MPRNEFSGIMRGIVAILALTVVLESSAWTQITYQTLHAFTGGKDGSGPFSALTVDSGGNLYGTTLQGGTAGYGTVYELKPNANGTWTQQVIYNYTSGQDGASPFAGVVFDAAGNLYGTTIAGGNLCGNEFSFCGVVFQLTPNSEGTWTESVLYRFTGGGDGWGPEDRVIFDNQGNLYGTTDWGGDLNCGVDGYGCGVVFKLTPNPDGTWTESTLYAFAGSRDGSQPYGLVFDAAGGLYGTTVTGGGQGSCSPGGCGTVFKLTPGSGGTYTWKGLHGFTGGSDGANPRAGLIFDSAGNLYGTSPACGAYGYGNVFQLTPNSNESWTFQMLHQFTGGKDGSSPWAAGLALDQAGNLYGTTPQGGEYGYGVVFKLTPTSPHGWKFGLLHSFEDKPGAGPDAGVILDASGNLYGTTFGDAINTFGSVFKITQ